MKAAVARAKDIVVRFDAMVDARVDDVRGRARIDRLMYEASELGDFALIWHLIGAGRGLLPGRDPISSVQFSMVMGAESLLVNGAIKSMFRRHRPVWESERPRPHRLRTPRSSSFPSGHASAAFTAAMVLSRDDPLGPLYFALAGVVASSRVYVKIHHASDVVAGAAIGVALGAVARRVLPR